MIQSLKYLFVFKCAERLQVAWQCQVGIAVTMRHRRSLGNIDPLNQFKTQTSESEGLEILKV